MSCNEYKPLIALFVGGDLDENDIQRISDHLKRCNECRIFADELERSRNALKFIAASVVSPYESSKLHSAVMGKLNTEKILPSRDGQRYFHGYLRRWKHGYALALILIALVIITVNLIVQRRITNEIPLQSSEQIYSNSGNPEATEAGNPKRAETPSEERVISNRKSSGSRIYIRHIEPKREDLNTATRTTVSDVGERGYSNIAQTDAGLIQTASTQQVVYKIKTADPRVVIYWISELSKGEEQ